MESLLFSVAMFATQFMHVALFAIVVLEEAMHMEGNNIN